MDAEMLRDVALQSSGLLVNKIGGPSVKPYQPRISGSRSASGSDTLNYEQQHGDALYRRSMYTYWKRMATMPDMDAFDAPMRDVVMHAPAAHRHAIAGAGDHERCAVG
jgi:hypothetical protein